MGCDRPPIAGRAARPVQFERLIKCLITAPSAQDSAEGDVCETLWIGVKSNIPILMIYSLPTPTQDPT